MGTIIDYVLPETTMSYRIKHIKSIGYHECYSIVTPGYKHALLEDFTVIPIKGWSDGSNL